MGKQETIAIMAAIIYAAKTNGKRPEGQDFRDEVGDATLVAEQLYNEVEREV